MSDATTGATAAAAPTGPAPQLTPAEITYLITTRGLPFAEITDPDIKAAAQNIKGDGKQIGHAARVVMAGLIALRDDGAISLEYVMRKKLMVKLHHVETMKTGATHYSDHDFEGRLFQQVPDEPVKVANVVSKWFGGRVDNPAGALCSTTWLLLTEKGLVGTQDVEVARGRLDGVLSGSKTKVEHEAVMHPEVIAQTLPQVVEWSKRWTAWWNDETELATHLFGEVSSAINAMARPAEGDDGPD